jgi:hypothetical protein
VGASAEPARTEGCPVSGLRNISENSVTGARVCRSIGAAAADHLAPIWLQSDLLSESPRPTPVSPNPGDRPARGLVVSAFIVGTADHVHAAVSPQQIAVPSYIHPGADPGAWNRLIGAPSEKAGITVANVLNGPDFRRKPIWTDVMARAHGSGKRVLGYVDTGYLGLTGQKTRLGSSDPADWIAQAEQDINVWYALYGESLDGIFFDQGYNTCGPNNDFASWYDHLNQFEKRHHPGALTVLNPGAVVPQCYEDTADILLM